MEWAGAQAGAASLLLLAVTAKLLQGIYRLCKVAPASGGHSASSLAHGPGLGLSGHPLGLVFAARRQAVEAAAEVDEELAWLRSILRNRQRPIATTEHSDRSQRRT